MNDYYSIQYTLSLSSSIYSNVHLQYHHSQYPVLSQDGLVSQYKHHSNDLIILNGLVIQILTILHDIDDSLSFSETHSLGPLITVLIMSITIEPTVDPLVSTQYVII